MISDYLSFLVRQDCPVLQEVLAAQAAHQHLVLRVDQELGIPEDFIFSS